MALTGVLLTLVGCKKDETEPTDSASIPKISVSEPKVYTSEAATYIRAKPQRIHCTTRSRTRVKVLNLN